MGFQLQQLCINWLIDIAILTAILVEKIICNKKNIFVFNIANQAWNIIIWIGWPEA